MSHFPYIITRAVRPSAFTCEYHLSLYNPISSLGLCSSLRLCRATVFAALTTRVAKPCDYWPHRHLGLCTSAVGR